MLTIKPPTATQLKANNMGLIPNPYLIVESNGKVVKEWNGKNFVVVTGTVSINTQMYAIPNSWLVSELILTSDGSLYSSPLNGTKI